VIARDALNLGDTADALHLDRQRLQRLGHYLRISSGDRCIPLSVVIEAQAQEDEEKRYRVVLDWLLENVRIGATSGDGAHHLAS
jgi:hypothetical protein